MSLKQQLIEDMKQAMKKGDKVALAAVRFLRAEIQKVEIDHGEQDDAGVQKIIVKQVKQMNDAIADFEAGGRADLVAEETAKVKILEQYLPAQLSDEQLQSIIDEVVSQTEQHHMGPLIQAVMQRAGESANGKRVAELVRARLG